MAPALIGRLSLSVTSLGSGLGGGGDVVDGGDWTGFGFSSGHTMFIHLLLLYSD